MAVTDDRKLAEKAMSYRNFCFDKERRFIHDDIGFKYSLSNLLAAIGLAQLEYIEKTMHVLSVVINFSNVNFGSSGSGPILLRCFEP